MDAKTKDIRETIQLAPEASDAEIVATLRAAGLHVFKSWVKEIRKRKKRSRVEHNYLDRHVTKVTTALVHAGITAEQAKKFLDVA